MPEEEKPTFYFVVQMRVVIPVPDDPDAVIGWLPVFRSPEAAKKHAHGIGDVGEITLDVPASRN